MKKLLHKIDVGTKRPHYAIHNINNNTVRSILLTEDLKDILDSENERDSNHYITYTVKNNNTYEEKVAYFKVYYHDCFI